MDVELEDFLRHCRLERRLADLTCRAYEHVAARELQTAADALAVHAGLGGTPVDVRSHQLSFGS